MHGFRLGSVVNHSNSPNDYTDGPRLHSVCRERDQDSFPCFTPLTKNHDALPVGHRHPRMDLSDELFRFACGDRAGVQPFVVRGIFPAFPQPGKDEWRIVFHADCVGNLAAYHLMPQSKIVCLKSGGAFISGLPSRSASGKVHR